MAMPKKGLRKIVVDGKTYNYVIKRISRTDSINKRLTIELSAGEYYSEDIEDGVDQVTPSMIEKIIRETS
jgi:hypothetical protein